MLGLQDERMASVVKEHWAEWVASSPVGGRRRPGPGWTPGEERPIRGRQRCPARLARLAAFDGADDREAALLWRGSCLPTALRVRRRLGLADDRVDEVLAAQLWVEVGRYRGGIRAAGSRRRLPVAA